MTDDADKRLIALRAIDKLDKIGLDGVRDLLTKGRKDGSGDFTPGAGFSEAQADLIVEFLKTKGGNNQETLFKMRRWFWVMQMPADELEKLSADIERVLREQTE